MAFFSGLVGRLIAGFVLIVGMMIGLTIFGVQQVGTIGASLTTISDLNSVKQRYAINFRGSVHDRAISLRDVVLMGGQDSLRENLSDIARLEGQYATSAVKLDAMLADGNASEDEKRILTSIKATESRTMPLMAAIIAKKQAGDYAGANALLIAEGRPAFVEWLARINQFIDLQEAKNHALTAETRQVAAQFQMLMLFLCAVAIIVGVAIALWNVATIKQLRPIAARMRELADGNLDVTIPQLEAVTRSAISSVSRAFSRRA